ncbi:MAG: C13 family peptidase [Pseudomonadota bacterium]|nr:C13 family peptidase [Pseudomonadota bacterium]
MIRRRLPWTALWLWLIAAALPAAAAPPDAAAILDRQPELVARELASLAPSRRGRTDLYFIAFAGFGGQDVFMKEALYAKALFAERFAAQGHALALINNWRSAGEAPLATVANLEAVLKGIARRMDRDEDILFLFLTSHGTEAHELAVQLPGVALPALSAGTLAGLLRASGIRWKVIVVSACFSGGFIDPLRDNLSLIITAARADRPSFGCSDDAELTWFGRAFLERALADSDSFVAAFARASALVGAWEAEQDYLPSQPQIASSPLIERQLARWRRGLPGR